MVPYVLPLLGREDRPYRIVPGIWTAPWPRLPWRDYVVDTKESGVAWLTLLYVGGMGGNYTRATVEVGRALYDCLNNWDQPAIDPCTRHQDLANRTGRHISTVKRGLNAIRDTGMTRWVPRYEIARYGQPARQTSNQYQLCMPWRGERGVSLPVHNPALYGHPQYRYTVASRREHLFAPNERPSTPILDRVNHTPKKQFVTPLMWKVGISRADRASNLVAEVRATRFRRLW